MTTAYWFTQHESGGFPIEKAALGSCDLSVLHVGGNWKWLVRLGGDDVAEGKARAESDAKRQAEAVAFFCSTWVVKADVG
jgi:hypothetical protein